MPTPSDYAIEIMDRCDLLATSSMDEGRITRPYGTTALIQARNQVAAWMQEAGMATRIDNVGNLFGRCEADSTSIGPKTFLIGGHIDSVVDAGRYDGILGVLSGIAAVQYLYDHGEQLPFAVEVVAFADEEGNRFHTSFLGSSPVAGLWDPSWLDLEDDDGIPLSEGIRAIGGDPQALASDALSPGTLLGFIEVHIEQGPVLQDRGLPVAAVSGITGSQRATIVLLGMAGHAGTVPMGLRRDALAGAAELVLAIERIGASVPGLVATVGKLEIAPGASNVIPGRAGLTLDLRHPDPDVRNRTVGEIRSHAAEVATRRGLALEWVDAPSFAETLCDERLTTLLREAIAAEGVEPIDLFSGAGHDAITMANITPVTMMFVRCRDGISHNPAESIVLSDVGVALEVLVRFLQSVPATR
jgi:allantoate deiminase